MSARRWIASAAAVALLCSLTVGCDADEDEHFYVIAPKYTVAVGESLQLEGQSQFGGIGYTCSQKHEESKRGWSGAEVDWSVSPAEGASISGSGVFVATEPGAYTVTGRPKRDGEGYVEEPSTINVVEAIVHKDGAAEDAEIDPDTVVPIWDNHNPGGVENGGTAPTFELDRPIVLTYLETYHYNSGQGTAKTGRIGLKAADGTEYGPWDTEGLPGQGDVPNAYWIAKPNVELPAGSYTVIDPDPATWSQNAGSNGEGMVRVMGVPTE